MNEVQKITTNELARHLGVKPSTIRRSLCVQGHYMGMRPVKLPNRRLLWSVQDVEKLLSGEKQELGAGYAV